MNLPNPTNPDNWTFYAAYCATFLLAVTVLFLVNEVISINIVPLGIPIIIFGSIWIAHNIVKIGRRKR